MGTSEYRDNLPPMPDLGLPETIPHPDGSGAMLMNTAMMVAVAREAGTPQAIVFYRAFVQAWDRLKDMPGPENDRRVAAAEAAAIAVGATLVL